MENSTIDKTMTQATNFDAQEPIHQDTQDRFVLFPIQYEEMWHMYKCAEASFWVAEEIDLADDMIDWEEKLNDNERHFIKHVLAFLRQVMELSTKTWLLILCKTLRFLRRDAFMAFKLPWKIFMPRRIRC